MQLFQIMILRQTSPRIPWFHRTHLRIRNSRLLPSFQSPQKRRFQSPVLPEGAEAAVAIPQSRKAQKGAEGRRSLHGAEAAIAEGAEAALVEEAEAAVAEGAEAAVAQGARGTWSC